MGVVGLKGEVFFSVCLRAGVVLAAQGWLPLSGTPSSARTYCRDRQVRTTAAAAAAASSYTPARDSQPASQPAS
eukprot:COSAG02_NODE_1013_length_15207_cov_4.700556_8_plen_74_part_00